MCVFRLRALLLKVLLKTVYFLTAPENFGLSPTKPPKSCKILISRFDNLLSGINPTLKEFLFFKAFVTSTQ